MKTGRMIDPELDRDCDGKDSDQRSTCPFDCSVFHTCSVCWFTETDMSQSNSFCFCDVHVPV